jgi:hypothetical protein
VTEEEKAEIKALEAEEAERVKALKAAEAQRHLEALRLVKKLRGSHGEPGLDFVVLETRIGVIAIKRPVDVEIDSIGEDRDRADLEKFAAALVIHPSSQEVIKLMSQHHGLVGGIVKAAFDMLKVVREEEGKR